MTSSWHIWVIKQNKFDIIKSFLDSSVPEVEEVFFPTVVKERKVGNRLYKGRVPLYSGYLFLKYSDANNKVFYKIRSNPFITTYVGICNQASVEVMKQKEEWNALNKHVQIGDLVEVFSGPMKNCRGIVHTINGNKLTIKVELFGRTIDSTFSAEDVEIIKKV